MDFEPFKYYVSQIVANKLANRDIDSQKSITTIFHEMNARGVLHSTITLQKMAEFLDEEFKCRCQFIKDLLLESLPKLDNKKTGDPVGKIITLYQEIAFSEKTKLTTCYNHNCEFAGKPLLNKSFIVQHEEAMKNTMDKFLRENNAILQFECTALFNSVENAFVVPKSVKFALEVISLAKKIFTS